MAAQPGDVLLRPLEFLLNRGLERSTSAAAAARALDGRALALEVEGLPFAVRLAVLAGPRLRLTMAGEEPVDATLRGAPLGLGRMMQGDPQATLRTGTVTVTGDAEVAEKFRELLFWLRPDPEEELSRVLGDPVAHQVGEFGRSVAAWGREAGESLSRSLGEYLHEESRLLPTRAEVRDFARRVDELANDLARAEARLDRLGGRR